MNLTKFFKNSSKSSSSYTILDNKIQNQGLPKWIDQLLEKRIDGFVIRQALSKDALNQIITQFDDVAEEIKILLPNGEGLVYPLPYSMVHSESLKEKYFTTIPLAEPHLKQKLSKNPKDFVIDLLSVYTDRNIQPVPKMKETAFSAINFRKLRPDSTGISIHCENSFLHQLDDGFRTHLSSHLDLFNQLSFFFVVKKDEESGDIVLYNKEWNNFSVKHENFTDEEQKSDDLVFFKLNNAQNILSQEVHLNEGDLFVFRAGQIWHRVKNIKNSGDRITIGGFLGESVQSDNIYFWA